MLNAQIARARVTERTKRGERRAQDIQLLASSRPDKYRQRHRKRPAWTPRAERAPIQA